MTKYKYGTYSKAQCIICYTHEGHLFFNNKTTLEDFQNNKNSHPIHNCHLQLHNTQFSR